MSFFVLPEPSIAPGGYLSIAALDYSQDMTAMSNALLLLAGAASAVAGVERLAFDSLGPCDVYQLLYMQPGNDNQNVRIRVSNNDQVDIFDLSGVTFNAFNRGAPFVKSNPVIPLKFNRLKIYVTTQFIDVNAVQNFYGYIVRKTA